MRCLSGAKLVDDCVCAALRASVTSICSVEVFLYWLCIVSPTGTFPLDSFLLVVVGMVGVRARVFLFGVRQNKAIRSFLEGSSFYFLTHELSEPYCQTEQSQALQKLSSNFSLHLTGSGYEGCDVSS